MALAAAKAQQEALAKAQAAQPQDQAASHPSVAASHATAAASHNSAAASSRHWWRNGNWFEEYDANIFAPPVELRDLAHARWAYHSPTRSWVYFEL